MGERVGYADPKLQELKETVGSLNRDVTSLNDEGLGGNLSTFVRKK